MGDLSEGVTDPDRQKLTYTFAGTASEHEAFDLDADTGELTVKTGGSAELDYEGDETPPNAAPDNTREFTVVVSDGASEVRIAVSVEITDDPEVLTPMVSELSGIEFTIDEDYSAGKLIGTTVPVSYTHLRAHETGRNLVCRIVWCIRSRLNYCAYQLTR